MGIQVERFDSIGHKKINEVEKKGYEYHSYHSWDKEEAVKEAKKVREGGDYYAQCVPSTQHRRIGGQFNGWSVYKKAKVKK